MKFKNLSKLSVMFGALESTSSQTFYIFMLTILPYRTHFFDQEFVFPWSTFVVQSWPTCRYTKFGSKCFPELQTCYKMHECVTTSTYSTRAKPDCCMYLWLRTSALYSIEPSLGCINWFVVQYKVSADSV